jgi:ribonuclease HI
LYELARRLIASFARVELRHVRREFNAEADRLANEAIDGA